MSKLFAFMMVVLLAGMVSTVGAQQNEDSELPLPGDWAGVAEFGEFAFTVNADGNAITGITYSWNWACGSVLWSGYIEIGDAEWPIEEGEFTIENQLGAPPDTYTMSLTGSFEDDFHASGTWEMQTDRTCIGTWAAWTKRDIVSEYTVLGTNPDGSEYEGQLEIAVANDIYQITWSVGAEYYGIGIQREGVVAATWGESCGVIAYVIEADGSLDGLWAYPGQEELTHEQATPVAEGEKSLIGTYTITGIYADGSEYTGEIEITTDGQLYYVVWFIDEAYYYGVGIRQADVLSVGWDVGGTCGVAAYVIEAEGVLDGIWAYWGQEQFATERLIPGVATGDRT